MGLNHLISINRDTKDHVPLSAPAPLWLSLVEGLVPLTS